MLTQLQCPTCNAPLAYDGAASTIQCPYCDNTFVVPVALRSTRAASPYWQTLDFSALDPGEQAAVMHAVEEIEELVQRGDKIGAIKLYRTTFGSELAAAKAAIDAVTESGSSARRPGNAPAPVAGPTPSDYVGSVYDLHQPAPRRNGCLSATIIGLVLLVIGGVLAGVFVTSRTVRTSIDDVMKVVQQASSVDVPAEVQQITADLTGSPARLIGRFGAEGIGPGKFEDARAIAVDNAGRLYVGEYTSGRIQVFDTMGAFQAQWKLGDNNFYVDQFAADRSGRLYIPYGGELGVYDGTTGNPAGDLPPVDVGRFAAGYTDSAAIGADGAIYAVWDDDIVRLNQAGEVTLRIENAIEVAVGGLETTTKIAVDGLGNIYALGESQDVVVKFDDSGAFVDRVAVANRGADDEESKLRAASALAVDGRGRVFVADIFGIKVYDEDGQYRATLDIPGVAFGLAIDDNDILSIAARTEVLRYQLQP